LLKFDAHETVTKATFRLLPHPEGAAKGVKSETALPDLETSASPPIAQRQLAGRLLEEPSLLNWVGGEQARSFSSLAISPGSRRLAIGTYTDGVLLMDAVGGEITNLDAGASDVHVGINSKWMRPVDSSPDGRRVAAGGDYGNVWDAGTHVEVWRLSRGDIGAEGEGTRPVAEQPF
jgi:hypothetical protein